jgi:galactose mutarotase-like enzyme
MPKDAPVTLHNDLLTLEVAATGAEMQSLRTASGEELLWQGDAAFWSGRAPLLFPIVGRAVDDVIAVDEYSAPMPQHGFARHSLFSLDKQTDAMCTHTLIENAQTLAIYPFRFMLSVTHTLCGATLNVTATVRNTDSRLMPFCFGFHPAFRWPLPHANDTAHHITFANGGNPARARIDNGLLDPALVEGPFERGDLVLQEALFGEGALVFPNGADALRYGPRGGPSLDFRFQNLPDLALWKPAGAPFICIEPWHGTASYRGDGPQIAQRPNAIELAPKAQATFSYSVTIRT